MQLSQPRSLLCRPEYGCAGLMQLCRPGKDKAGCGFGTCVFDCQAQAVPGYQTRLRLMMVVAGVQPRQHACVCACVSVVALEVAVLVSTSADRWCVDVTGCFMQIVFFLVSVSSVPAFT